jgi:Domain of unknown function (DUF6881)
MTPERPTAGGRVERHDVAMATPAHHWKVVWNHGSPDDPVVLYHELDSDLWELRKVEVYADGRMDLADPARQTGTTWLSDQPLTPLEEIQAQPEFQPEAISATEFEAIWNAAVRQPHPSG